MGSADLFVYMGHNNLGKFPNHILSWTLKMIKLISLQAY